MTDHDGGPTDVTIPIRRRDDPPTGAELEARLRRMGWDDETLTPDMLACLEDIAAGLRDMRKETAMSDQLGDAPIEPAYIEKMNQVAHALDEVFNGGKHGNDRTTGFVLLVFPFGSQDGRCNYISNGADRRDIVKLFTEQIKRFEEQR
jgi:hypothetical protein